MDRKTLKTQNPRERNIPAQTEKKRAKSHTVKRTTEREREKRQRNERLDLTRESHNKVKTNTDRERSDSERKRRAREWGGKEAQQLRERNADVFSGICYRIVSGSSLTFTFTSPAPPPISNIIRIRIDCIVQVYTKLESETRILQSLENRERE